MPAPSGRISCEKFDRGEAATVERPGRFWFGKGFILHTRRAEALMDF
jgi:hypothetical protein